MARSPLHLIVRSADGKRKVVMTAKCKEEFADFPFQTREMLQNFMRLWANAKSHFDEPSPDKFKKLGLFATGVQKLGKIEMAEFKFKIARVYGAVYCDPDCMQIVLTRASDSDKGGQTKKRQTAGIATAAKRFGSWYNENS